MNRPIKFRGWDPRRKRMTNDLGMERNDDGTQSVAGFERVVPLQFTGLTDKDGKEIYEGDIVRSAALNASAEVRYGNAHFFIIGGTAAQPLVRAGWELSNNADDVEVIGNIYENPDLLSA